MDNMKSQMSKNMSLMSENMNLVCDKLAKQDEKFDLILAKLEES